MLRIFRNKKAQTTAEYAILIAVVVAALVAMQTYVKRGLQGRMRDATDTFANTTSNIGSTTQYEPYYLNQATNVASTTNETENVQAGGAINRGTNATTNREGRQTYGW